MHYLIVVDLQKEFVKGLGAKPVYDRCLKFVQRAAPYCTIIAPVYQNRDNLNMYRLVEWKEMTKIVPLEFKPHYIYMHSGYAIKEYPKFEPGDQVDVIGFDTDACVLATCFRLFDLGVNFRILVDGCWSSGGASMHKAGLKVMQRQFSKAVDTTTKLDDLFVHTY